MKFSKEHTKYAGLIGFALLLLLIFTDFHPIAWITGERKNTSSPAFGFSVTHPGIWDARQYADGGYRGDETVVFIISSDLVADFNGIRISRQPANNPTLEEVAEWGKDLRREDGWRLNRTYQGFEVSDLQKEMIGDYPVLRRIYRVDIRNAVDEDVYLARQNDMIIFTLRTTQEQYDNLIGEFNLIITSFTPKE
ncbi:hypothetical protein [Candidatus Leptofilum sp.]|uniref:hypothetical protein n=1 Tax=Candidatus Leptofilum sp. TaxID=3241576 RepID=UPI003B5C4CE0